MSRGWIVAAILIAIALAAPYASLLIHRALGTTTAGMITADGARSTLVMGPDAPRPDWLPVAPGARVMTASRWMTQEYFKDGGDLAVLARGELGALKAFYAGALAAQGFAVEDLGLGGLAPPLAAYMGVAGTLIAERPATGHELSVSIRTPQGFLTQVRVVEIHWRELHPGQPSSLEAARRLAAGAPPG